MLTLRQRTFARYISLGASYTYAYRVAYGPNKMHSKTVWEAASRLSKNPKVIARLEELKAEKEAAERMLRVPYENFVINELQSLALKSTSDKVRIKALELLGKTINFFDQ